MGKLRRRASPDLCGLCIRTHRERGALQLSVCASTYLDLFGRREREREEKSPSVPVRPCLRRCMYVHFARGLLTLVSTITTWATTMGTQPVYAMRCVCVHCVYVLCCFASFSLSLSHTHINKQSFGGDGDRAEWKTARSVRDSHNEICNSSFLSLGFGGIKCPPSISNTIPDTHSQRTSHRHCCVSPSSSSSPFTSRT